MEEDKQPSKRREALDRKGAHRAAGKSAGRSQLRLRHVRPPPPPVRPPAKVSAHRWTHMPRAIQARRKRQKQSSARHRRAPAAPLLQEESCHPPAALAPPAESSLIDPYPL